MQARALLMIEHRLIERMIAVIRNALEEAERTHSIDPLLVDVAVDFIRVYADRTHHGKEEDILFRDLRKKSLSDVDTRLMNELIKEHVFGRETTRALLEANDRHRSGERAAFAHVTSRLGALVGFYPEHIKKEDKVFFPASRAYFSDEEDQAMLVEFREFDQKMIHDKYASVVRALEKQADPRTKS